MLKTAGVLIYGKAVKRVPTVDEMVCFRGGTLSSTTDKKKDNRERERERNKEGGGREARQRGKREREREKVVRVVWMVRNISR